MHAGELVLEDGELVNLAELVEHRAQVFLLHVPRDLTYEQLDSVMFFMRRRSSVVLLVLLLLLVDRVAEGGHELLVLVVLGLLLLLRLLRLLLLLLLLGWVLEAAASLVAAAGAAGVAEGPGRVSVDVGGRHAVHAHAVHGGQVVGRV